MRALVAGWFVLMASLLLAASSASADLDAPCTGSINGVDAGSHDASDVSEAIPVQNKGTVTYTLNAPAEITFWWVDLHYGPFSQTLDEGSDPIEDPEPDTSKTDTASVEPYAWMGVGLYELTAGVAYDGGSCTGTMLSLVEGNPLTTVMGAGGAGATVIGLGGIGGAAAGGLKP